MYHHTELKNDINRNMLATLYVRDPHKFNENDEEVQKVLSSNIAWPKGYIPEEHPVVKPPLRMTKDELHYLELKDKHYVRMRPLNKYYLDDEIVDLPKLAQTSGCHATYKEHGWKASFNIKKGISKAEEERKRHELRMKSEMALP